MLFLALEESKRMFPVVPSFGIDIAVSSYLSAKRFVYMKLLSFSSVCLSVLRALKILYVH